MQIVHNGRGWHDVMDGDRKVAGPLRLEAAQQFAENYVKPPEALKPGLVNQREYERRLDAQLRADRSQLSEAVKAAIVATFDEETATRMMRDIDPILALGREGRRRERVPFARIPPKTAAAAA